jgi:hypothetical protein
LLRFTVQISVTFPSYFWAIDFTVKTMAQFL